MSKVTLSNITGGYAAPAIINADLAAIEAAFDNTLSLDGSSPNAMLHDLDLNGHNILNQGNPVTLTGGFNWKGTWLTGTHYAVGDAVFNTNSSYVCIVVHTSGTFATDLAASKWQLLASGSLPTQAGSAGKFLTTDGSSTSWAASPVIDVKNKPYNAVADGTTDDSSAIQAAIDATSSAGFGTVVFNGVFAISTQIVPKSNVGLRFTPGSYLKWTGSTSGICFETLSTSVLTNCQWEGLKVNTGASFTGTAFRFHSMNAIRADFITAETTGTTSKAFVFTADSSSGGDAFTKRNIVNVKIGALHQKGVCGTFFQSSGIAVGYGGSANVVTLNSFGHTFSEDSRVKGYDFVSWTDNNSFSGMNRVSINADNAIGLAHSDASGSGVYDNEFEALGVDTFSTFSNRIGVKLRNTKGFKIGRYYQDPVAEGGALDIDNTVQSYNINLHRDTQGDILQYQRQTSQVGGGFNSSVAITLSDDTATSIDMTGYGTQENIYFTAILTSFNADANGQAHCHVRRSSGSPDITAQFTGANFNTTTGVLAGTTSTDTKLTMSPAADGKLYIENRLGISITFVVTILGYFMVS